MKGIIIKPIKDKKQVISSKDCIGCIYRPANKKNCNSCGNWNNRL
jgi:hypothetical protein